MAYLITPSDGGVLRRELSKASQLFIGRKSRRQGIYRAEAMVNVLEADGALCGVRSIICIGYLSFVGMSFNHSPDTLILRTDSFCVRLCHINSNRIINCSFCEFRYDGEVGTLSSWKCFSQIFGAFLCFVFPRRNRSNGSLSNLSKHSSFAKYPRHLYQFSYKRALISTNITYGIFANHLVSPNSIYKIVYVFSCHARDKQLPSF